MEGSRKGQVQVLIRADDSRPRACHACKERGFRKLEPHRVAAIANAIAGVASVNATQTSSSSGDRSANPEIARPSERNLEKRERPTGQNAETAGLATADRRFGSPQKCRAGERRDDRRRLGDDAGERRDRRVRPHRCPRFFGRTRRLSLAPRSGRPIEPAMPTHHDPLAFTACSTGSSGRCVPVP